MITDNERYNFETILNVRHESIKIRRHMNGIEDKRKRRSIHVTENRKTNIEFNDGHMIKNCVEILDTSFSKINVKIIKPIERIENRSANVNVGDRSRSIAFGDLI